MPINIPPQKNCTFLFASRLYTYHYQCITVAYCSKAFININFSSRVATSKKHKALATFTAYASYPALDCLSQNFVQCGQAINLLRRLFGHVQLEKI